ncbi:MAG: undecaprenyl-phosphate glucose phosphotransferase [Halobacteriovorax sp.]|nr:undecaprenyl-phosphate glucose phosphotransferase [Halobacteriovorax sp.]|tara:strand:+ start:32077 stop:33453 length:1377 start_codon:yes stop_codon:yes gene_type:complete
MLKAHEKSFSNLQKGLDVLVVCATWWLAYFIRFNYLPSGEQGLAILFLKLTPVLALTSLYCLSKNGLYQSQRFTHRYREIFSVVQGNTIGVVSFVLMLYFFGDERLSRLTLLIYFGLSTLTLIIVRMSVRNFLRALRKKGKNLRHVLLIGNGDPIKKYIENARLFKDSGINFIGWLDSEGKAEESKVPVLSGEFESLSLDTSPDAIVLSYKSKDSEKIESFLAKNYNDLTPIQILPDLSYSLVGNQIDDFGGIPLLSVNQPSFGIVELFFKRLVDILGSLIGLIILFPFLFTLGILIKLSSKGPVFYGQERLGLDGSTFLMWKFRTMKVAEGNEDKTEWSNKENPRKTRLGDFMRKTSLDELPQLWNVLKGNMSLVGPRPERPFFVKKFKEEIPGYMLRHKMRAGITGWAQINGWRGDTSLHKRIECDIYYIKHWSFWFDIKILFLTIFKGFVNKNAY